VKNEKLFDQFPPVSTEEWMHKIREDLKGADFKENLVWKTGEGFEVMPFYRKEDLENLLYINTLPSKPPYTRGTKSEDNKWRIRQDIEVSDFAAANHKVLDIIDKGVDSIGFIITDPESVNEKDFKVLLENIPLKELEINFHSNGKAKEILDLLIKAVTDRDLDPVSITGAIEADPIGRLIMNGKLCVPVEAGFDYLAGLTSSSSSSLPNLRTIHLNASHFSNSGAGIVKELAYGISAGSEYLAQLTERGIDAATAASVIRFSFGTGSHYFPEIAKLRAGRLLWSAVMKGYGISHNEEVKMDIHCITSKRNKSGNDPYVNLVRTQTEAMSAILGGTNSLTVDPFDITFGHPDEFSERIARNQQLILREEAFFDKVIDPAGGSYYVENLTQLIAERSWKLFVGIEHQGGFLESLKSGFITFDIPESL
jgi:methylmalonyl-CoA mutase